jgi:hypothetical protein
MATITFLSAGTDETRDLTFFPLGYDSASPGNEGSSGFGTCVSSSAQAHTGGYSIQAQCTSAGNGFPYVVTPNGVVSDAGAAVSFWVRFSTIAPSVRTVFFGVEQAGDGNTVFGLALDTNGKIMLATQAGAFIPLDGITTLVANTWYRIAASYTITAIGNFTIKVYVNGVLDSTGTATSIGPLTYGISSCVLFGLTAIGTNFITGPAAMTAWYDDLYIDNRSDLSDPGNISVTAKRPFSNGTTNSFATTGTPSGYGSGHAPYVNGNYPVGSDTTTYVSITSAGFSYTEEYNLEGSTVGDVNLAGAALVGYGGWVFATSLTGETANILVNNAQSAISLTSTAALFSAFTASASYPNGTGTDIGIITSGTVTTVTLYAAGVLVAFIPGVSTPVVPGPADPWATTPPRPYPLDLRTTTNNLLGSTLMVPFVAHQSEHPLPVVTHPYPGDLRTQTNNLLATTLKPPATMPFAPVDLPPTAPKPYPAELRTGLATISALTLPGPNPIPQIEWGVLTPVTHPYPGELRTSTANLLQTTLAPTVTMLPRANYDQPTPRVTPYPLDLRTFISYYQLDNNLPFVQMVDALPPTRPYPLDLRTSTANILTSTLVPPFVGRSSDQPLPSVTHPYPIDLRTATTDLITTTLKPAATFPLVADVDLLPPTKPYPLDLRTQTNALLESTLKPPVVIPVQPNYFDVWWARPYALDLRTSTVNLLQGTLGPAAGNPFENFDQPLPAARPLYPIDLRTWFNNLLESTLAPVSAVPLHPVDTTGTFTRPYPTDLRTATTNLLQSTLQPPPFVVDSWEIARPNTPAYPIDLRTATTNLLTTTLVPPITPVIAIDSGLTFGRTYPFDLRTTTLNLLQGTLGLTPLFLLDQPLPAARPPYPSDLRTATLNLIATTLKPAQTFPFVTLIDALPPVRPYPSELRTATVNLLTNTFVPPPPAPTITDHYLLGVVSGFGNSHTPNLGGLAFDEIE